MGRRAIIINKLRDMGYTVEEDDSIISVSTVANGGKLFMTFLKPYELFQTNVIDDVERTLNNLIIEDACYGGGDL